MAVGTVINDDHNVSLAISEKRHRHHGRHRRVSGGRDGCGSCVGGNGDRLEYACNMLGVEHIQYLLRLETVSATDGPPSIVAWSLTRH